MSSQECIRLVIDEIKKNGNRKDKVEEIFSNKKENGNDNEERVTESSSSSSSSSLLSFEIYKLLQSTSINGSTILEETNEFCDCAFIWSFVKTCEVLSLDMSDSTIQSFSRSIEDITNQYAESKKDLDFRSYPMFSLLLGVDLDKEPIEKYPIIQTNTLESTLSIPSQLIHYFQKKKSNSFQSLGKNNASQLISPPSQKRRRTNNDIPSVIWSPLATYFLARFAIKMITTPNPRNEILTKKNVSNKWNRNKLENWDNLRRILSESILPFSTKNTFESTGARITAALTCASLDMLAEGMPYSNQQIATTTKINTDMILSPQICCQNITQNAVINYLVRPLLYRSNNYNTNRMFLIGTASSCLVQCHDKLNLGTKRSVACKFAQEVFDYGMDIEGMEEYLRRESNNYYKESINRNAVSNLYGMTKQPFASSIYTFYFFPAIAIIRADLLCSRFQRAMDFVRLLEKYCGKVLLNNDVTPAEYGWHEIFRYLHSRNLLKKSCQQLNLTQFGQNCFVEFLVDLAATALDAAHIGDSFYKNTAMEDIVLELRQICVAFYFARTDAVTSIRKAEQAVKMLLHDRDHNIKNMVIPRGCSAESFALQLYLRPPPSHRSILQTDRSFNGKSQLKSFLSSSEMLTKSEYTHSKTHHDKENMRTDTTTNKDSGLEPQLTNRSKIANTTNDKLNLEKQNKFEKNNARKEFDTIDVGSHALKATQSVLNYYHNDSPSSDPQQIVTTTKFLEDVEMQCVEIADSESTNNEDTGLSVEGNINDNATQVEDDLEVEVIDIESSSTGEESDVDTCSKEREKLNRESNTSHTTSEIDEDEVCVEHSHEGFDDDSEMIERYEHYDDDSSVKTEDEQEISLDKSRPEKLSEIEEDEKNSQNSANAVIKTQDKKIKEYSSHSENCDNNALPQQHLENDESMHHIDNTYSKGELDPDTSDNTSEKIDVHMTSNIMNKLRRNPEEEKAYEADVELDVTIKGLPLTYPHDKVIDDDSKESSSVTWGYRNRIHRYIPPRMHISKNKNQNEVFTRQSAVALIDEAASYEADADTINTRRNSEDESMMLKDGQKKSHLKATHVELEEMAYEADAEMDGKDVSNYSDATDTIYNKNEEFKRKEANTELRLSTIASIPKKSNVTELLEDEPQNTETMPNENILKKPTSKSNDALSKQTSAEMEQIPPNDSPEQNAASVPLVQASPARSTRSSTTLQDVDVVSQTKKKVSGLPPIAPKSLDKSTTELAENSSNTTDSICNKKQETNQKDTIGNNSEGTNQKDERENVNLNSHEETQSKHDHADTKEAIVETSTEGHQSLEESTPDKSNITELIECEQSQNIENMLHDSYATKPTSKMTQIPPNDSSEQNAVPVPLVQASPARSTRSITGRPLIAPKSLNKSTKELGENSSNTTESICNENQETNQKDTIGNNIEGTNQKDERENVNLNSHEDTQSKHDHADTKEADVEASMEGPQSLEESTLKESDITELIEYEKSQNIENTLHDSYPTKSTSTMKQNPPNGSPEQNSVRAPLVQASPARSTRSSTTLHDVDVVSQTKKKVSGLPPIAPKSLDKSTTELAENFSNTTESIYNKKQETNQKDERGNLNSHEETQSKHDHADTKEAVVETSTEGHQSLKESTPEKGNITELIDSHPTKSTSKSNDALSKQTSAEMEQSPPNDSPEQNVASVPLVQASPARSTRSSTTLHDVDVVSQTKKKVSGLPPIAPKSLDKSTTELAENSSNTTESICNKKQETNQKDERENVNLNSHEETQSKHDHADTKEAIVETSTEGHQSLKESTPEKSNLTEPNNSSGALSKQTSTEMEQNPPNDSPEQNAVLEPLVQASPARSTRSSKKLRKAATVSQRKKKVSGRPPIAPKSLGKLRNESVEVADLDSVLQSTPKKKMKKNYFSPDKSSVRSSKIKSNTSISSANESIPTRRSARLRNRLKREEDELSLSSTILSEQGNDTLKRSRSSETPDKKFHIKNIEFSNLNAATEVLSPPKADEESEGIKKKRKVTTTKAKKKPSPAAARSLSKRVTRSMRSRRSRKSTD